MVQPLSLSQSENQFVLACSQLQGDPLKYLGKQLPPVALFRGLHMLVKQSRWDLAVKVIELTPIERANSASQTKELMQLLWNTQAYPIVKAIYANWYNPIDKKANTSYKPSCFPTIVVQSLMNLGERLDKPSDALIQRYTASLNCCIEIEPTHYLTGRISEQLFVLANSMSKTSPNKQSTSSSIRLTPHYLRKLMDFIGALPGAGQKILQPIKRSVVQSAFEHIERSKKIDTTFGLPAMVPTDSIALLLNLRDAKILTAPIPLNQQRIIQNIPDISMHQVMLLLMPEPPINI